MFRGLPAFAACVLIASSARAQVPAGQPADGPDGKGRGTSAAAPSLPKGA